MAQKAPQIKLKVSDKQVEYGGSINISWKVEKAHVFYCKELNKELPFEGSMQIKPDHDGIYSFVAKKRRKTKTRRIKVHVTRPEIEYFKGSDSISDEGTGFLYWSVKNASHVKIQGIADSLPAIGKYELAIDTTREFTILVENSFGIRDSARITIPIWYEEELHHPNRVMLGQSAFIDFKFKNARFVSRLESKEAFNPSDTIIIKPENREKVSLLVHRNNGLVDTNVFYVDVIIPQIVEFKGTENIRSGQKASLSWKVIGNGRLELKGQKDSLPGIGKIDVFPKKTTTYTLQYSSHGKIETAKHKVVVYKRRFVKSLKGREEINDDVRIDFEIFATDFSRYPKEVKLYVLAVDTNGNFVQNLAPPYADKGCSSKYFRGLFEDIAGKGNQKVYRYSVREIHEEKEKVYDINITQDYSGSMGEYVKKMERATKLFIKKKHENDRISLVRFSDKLKREVPLYADKKILLDSIKFRGNYGGGTALYAGADEGLVTLEESNNDKMQLLFTDGFENSS
ncbi:MAG: hypothetical protein C0594_05350, partial [Marinilabiliales bacterium]